MVRNFQIYRGVLRFTQKSKIIALSVTPVDSCRKKAKDQSFDMVSLSRVLLKDAGNVFDKTLSEILVCPLSKQPLRFCEKTKSLVSDTIGVSFPIKDGIPCLVPKDGKILEEESEASKA